MRILTLDNKRYNLTNLPDELEDDLRFSVLDNSDVNEVDWHMAVGDIESFNDLEILPLTSLNDRGFDAFLFNPLKSYQAQYAEVKITNFYNDVKWYFPKMKNGQLLSVPITEGDNPLCAFFVKDISRQLECIDFGKLI